jgi:hypothetical protein
MLSEATRHTMGKEAGELGRAFGLVPARLQFVARRIGDVSLPLDL